MLLKVEYMEKIDLLTFLEDESEQLDFDGQVEVFWDKKHKLFEIELTFYAENKSGQVIEDVAGVSSEEPIISFSDSILLYSKETLVEFEATDYLVCLPYAGKKGWTLAEGKAFFSYLQVVLDNGSSDLLDFLNDSMTDVFELTWSNVEFEKFILDAKKHTPNGQLPYPKF